MSKLDISKITAMFATEEQRTAAAASGNRRRRTQHVGEVVQVKEG